MGPVTDGQKKTLEKLGILPDGIDNTGKAAKILDRLGKRRQERPYYAQTDTVSGGQGFQHVGTWQFETARKLIDRIAANGWRIPADISPQDYRGHDR